VSVNTLPLRLQVSLDGSGSHTHGASEYLVGMKWRDVASGAQIADAPSHSCLFPFGTYTVALTITDNLGGEGVALETIVVAPFDNVPGTLLEVHAVATGGAAAAALTTLPTAPPSHVALLPGAFVLRESVPVAGAVVLRMLGRAYFPAGHVVLAVAGATGALSFWASIDRVTALPNAPLPGSLIANIAQAGLYELDVRCAVVLFRCSSRPRSNPTSPCGKSNRHGSLIV
jgi:hypothetical protein